DCLNRCDIGTPYAVDRSDTGAGGDTIEMHRAGTAERHATAKFCTAHAEHITQDPQQRRIVIDIDAVCVSIDLYREHHGILSSSTHSAHLDRPRDLSLQTSMRHPRFQAIAKVAVAAPRKLQRCLSMYSNI